MAVKAGRTLRILGGAGTVLTDLLTPFGTAPVTDWTSDNGKSTFTNPVLNGDCPDPASSESAATSPR